MNKIREHGFAGVKIGAFAGFGFPFFVVAISLLLDLVGFFTQGGNGLARIFQDAVGTLLLTLPYSIIGLLVGPLIGAIFGISIGSLSFMLSRLQRRKDS